MPTPEEDSDFISMISSASAYGRIRIWPWELSKNRWDFAVNCVIMSMCH